MVKDMLRPSYSELMDIVKKSNRLDSRVTSRYTIVLAAARRARQLVNGAQPLTYAPDGDRAVSTAIKELTESKLRIKIQADLLDDNLERYLKSQEKNRTRLVNSEDDLNDNFKDNYDPVPYSSNYDNEDKNVDITPEVPLISYGDDIATEVVDIDGEFEDVPIEDMELDEED